MEQEVLSDTELILLDFLNYFHQNHSQEYVTVKQATLEHFTERTNDRTAGWSTVLELRQFYDWNKCQIPESGATIPPSVDGLTLYDFCDADTVARLTQVQRDCLTTELCGVSDPATLQINSVQLTTIPSGDTYDLAIHDSAGADVGTAANPSVVSDVTVTINGQSLGATGSVVAEGSLDIDVNLDGSPSGSWDGDSWEVTSGSASLEIDVFSDVGLTTPITSGEYGNVVYISLTPTGITPTEYLISFEGEVDSVKVSASSPYAWTIDVLGSTTIYAQAKDGSGNTCADSTPFSFTANLDTDADAIVTAQSIVSQNTKINIHNLVTSLKDYGIWSKLYALYPIFANTPTKQKFNWIDPQDTDAAFRLTFNGGTESLERNVIHNASNSYLDTHFNPSTDYTSTSDASMGVFSNLSTINNAACMGVGNTFVATDSIMIYPKFSNIFYGNVFGSTIAGTANTDASGMFVVTRGSSTEFSYHKRGSSTIDTTSVQGVSGVPNGNIWIGAGNRVSGSASNQYSSLVHGWAFIGKHLTIAEIDDLYTALNTFDQANC